MSIYQKWTRNTNPVPAARPKSSLGDRWSTNSGAISPNISKTLTKTISCSCTTTLIQSKKLSNALFTPKTRANSTRPNSICGQVMRKTISRSNRWRNYSVWRVCIWLNQLREVKQTTLSKNSRNFSKNQSTRIKSAQTTVSFMTVAKAYAARN